MTDDDSNPGDGPVLTRRRLLILGSAGLLGGAGVGAASLGGDDDQGTVWGGTMALSEAFNVAENLWIGPDSAKSTVDAEDGRVYMASDTQLDYYGDGGTWVSMGVGTSGNKAPASHFQSVTAESLETDDGFNSEIGDEVDYLDPMWLVRTNALVYLQNGFDSLDGISQTTSDSGSVSHRDPNRDIFLSTGATSGSVARIQAFITDTGNWGFDRSLRVRVAFLDSVADRTDDLSTGSPQPGNAGFGFRLTGGSLHAVSHDGTTENTTEIDPSPTAGTTYTLRAELDASAGEVTYYINGVEQTTHTSNVPAGGAGSETIMQFNRVENSTAADRRQLVRDWRLVEQEVGQGN